MQSIELERVGSLTQSEAKDIILFSNRGRLTKEITNVSWGWARSYERSDRLAKDICPKPCRELRVCSWSLPTQQFICLMIPWKVVSLVEGRKIRAFESLIGWCHHWWYAVAVNPCQVLILSARLSVLHGNFARWTVHPASHRRSWLRRTVKKLITVFVNMVKPAAYEIGAP